MTDDFNETALHKSSNRFTKLLSSNNPQGGDSDCYRRSGYKTYDCSDDDSDSPNMEGGFFSDN